MGVAKEDITRELLDRQGRQDERLFVFPIVCANRKADGLPPQRRAVVVENVEIDRIIAINGAGDSLCLAPAAELKGLRRRLVQHNGLGATMDLRRSDGRALEGTAASVGCASSRGIAGAESNPDGQRIAGAQRFHARIADLVRSGGAV